MLPVSSNLQDTMFTDVDISEISDRIEVMRLQEEKSSYKGLDYNMSDDENNKTLSYLETVSNPVDEQCRSMMCEWCYKVVDYCNLRRETVANAFAYLDRYVKTDEGLEVLAHRNVYRVAVMTALYIAIKVHESAMLDINVLVVWSAGSYSAQDFEEMEQKMLRALEWKLHGPTPADFIRHFVAIMSESVVDDSNNDILRTIQMGALYQAELVLSKLCFTSHKSSEIAFAAIVNALLDVDNKVLPLKTKNMCVRAIEQVSGLIVYDTVNVQINLLSLLEEQEDSSTVPTKSMAASSRTQTTKDTEVTANDDETTHNSTPSSSDKNHHNSSPVSVAVREKTQSVGLDALFSNLHALSMKVTFYGMQQAIERK